MNANPTGLFFRIDDSRGDGESHQLLVALDHDLRRLAAACFAQINQVLLADHRNAAEGDEFVLVLEAGLFRRAAFIDKTDHGMVSRFQVQHFEADRFVDFGDQIIGGPNAVSFRHDGQDIGARQGRDFLHLLPRFCHLSGDHHDLVSFAKALLEFIRPRLNVADNRGIHRHRQAHEINQRGDRKTENDVHERPGDCNQNLGQRRGGRNFFRGSIGAFQRFRGHHLGQLHESPGRNPAPRIVDSVPGPTHNFRPKANGKPFDLQATTARHPKMSEFVHKDSRAKQQQNRHDVINQFQNINHNRKPGIPAFR